MKNIKLLLLVTCLGVNTISVDALSAYNCSQAVKKGGVGNTGSLVTKAATHGSSNSCAFDLDENELAKVLYPKCPKAQLNISGDVLSGVSHTFPYINNANSCTKQNALTVVMVKANLQNYINCNSIDRLYTSAAPHKNPVVLMAHNCQ